MPAEYSFGTTQTVAQAANVLFNNGSRACRKGYVQHRDDSGIFTLRGVTNQCKAVYRVQFNANIAIADGGTDGGTVEPISVALTIKGEPLSNATATVTPAAIGDFFNVSVATFIDVPCGCCLSIAVRNVSATTAIDVTNANLIIDRVC